jgi:hypothetical protein
MLWSFFGIGHGKGKHDGVGAMAKSFFGIGHGKGKHDGVGAMVKQMLWSK